jgi:hypothetical protein
VVEPARTGVDVTIFISATPVLGIDAVQSIQFVSHFYQNNYAKDLEAWALELSTFEHFLKTVSAFKRVVFLAGDVHYAFGSSLAYWDQARQVTAKMINYTSSPLRNEGKDIGLLSTLYPELLDIFGKEEMPAIDFFAWDSDTLAHNQQLRRKIRGIILAQAYQHWWLVPRLLMALQVAALHSQYEIVLATEDWPKGSLRALPPDRSYRIRYLPDRRYQITEEAFPEEMKRSSGLPMKLAQWWLNVLLRAFRRVTFTRKKLSKTQNKIANRVVAPQGTPAALPQGTHHIARGTRKGLVLLENRLKKAEGLLRHAILDRQDLLSKKAGLYVVGYANLGEIGFHWSPKEKEVLQRLWWWHPNDPQKALPATEYCETLELPQLDEDPALS